MHLAETFPVTDAYRGMRLDRFLQHMLPRMSRASVQNAIGERVTLASGARAKPARRLATGDAVTIGPRGQPTVPTVVVPTLASGEGWVVVDKPAGIQCTPGSRRPGADVATLSGLAPVHRLDRFTSGCLLLSRDRATARAFDLAFRSHLVQKDYVAVVEGSPAHDCFDIDAPLGLDAASRVTGKVGVSPAGAAAMTRFWVLARHGGRALVRALPRTGRRHQIRVHLAIAGHAITGDVLYGPCERQFIRLQRGQPVATLPGLEPGRHLLHASRIGFADPVSRCQVEVAAPWPADFAVVMPAAVQSEAARLLAQLSSA